MIRNVFLDFVLVLQLKPELENEFYKKEAKDMVNIVQRLITDGMFQILYDSASLLNYL